MHGQKNIKLLAIRHHIQENWDPQKHCCNNVTPRMYPGSHCLFFICSALRPLTQQLFLSKILMEGACKTGT